MYTEDELDVIYQAGYDSYAGVVDEEFDDEELEEMYYLGQSDAGDDFAKEIIDGTY